LPTPGENTVTTPVAETPADPVAQPGPDATICRVTDLVPTVGYLAGNGLEFARQPVASGTSLYLHRRETVYSNAASDLEIFRVDPVAETEGQLTANDVEDYLLDVRGEAMLLQRQLPNGSPGGSKQLIYQDATQEVILNSQDSWPGLLWDAGGGLQAPPRRMVQQGVAAWREDGGVYRFHFGKVVEISAGHAATSAPWLDGNRVIWSSHDGADTEIWLWTSSGLQRLTDNDKQDQYPVVSGNKAYWLSDGAAMVMNFNTSELVMLDEGPCSAPDTDGGAAVFACVEPGEGVPDTWVPWSNHRRVFTYDGVATRELETLGGTAFAPRIVGDRVAWLEYPTSADFCYPTEVPGSVVVTLASGELAPRAVAEVGAGCYCCNAYWPEPRLAFTGSLLAWNYPVSKPKANPDEYPLWPYDMGVGYATLSEKRECTDASQP